jgi:hypothetical protein
MDKNTYHIPVDLIKSTTFKVEAENQRAAIDQLTAFLKEHEATNKMFTGFNIEETKIDCDQDDKIIEEVINDFKLETTKKHGMEFVTHTMKPWSDVEIPTDTISHYGYCGADFVYYVDSKAVGVIEAVIFDTTKNMELEMKVTLFSGMDDEYEFLKNLKDKDILLVHANEYGNIMIREIKGITFAGERSNTDVSQPTLHTCYVYNMKEIPGSFRTITQEDWRENYFPKLNK